MNIKDVKFSNLKCEDLKEMGYEEMKFVGNYVFFKKDSYECDVPKEIKLYIPKTPWSLRQLVNRDRSYVIESKRWIKDGLPRRNDSNLPAEVTYYKDGSVKDLKWFNDKGHYHRDNGKPAIVRFSLDGMVDDCFWLSKGQDFTDKVESFCKEKNWDRIRLKKEEIDELRSHFFSNTNYI